MQKVWLSMAREASHQWQVPHCGAIIRRLERYAIKKAASQPRQSSTDRLIKPVNQPRRQNREPVKEITPLDTTSKKHWPGFVTHPFNMEDVSNALSKWAHPHSGDQIKAEHREEGLSDWGLAGNRHDFLFKRKKLFVN